MNTTLYLVLLASLGYLMTDLYLPSLPAVAVYFHATDQEVQFTLFAYLLSFSLAPLLFGPLSDQIGRKKILISGILLGILGSFGFLFAPTIYFVTACRFLQGIGMGAVTIATRAVTADLFTGKALARQMSLTTMLMPLILAIAPVAGGFLQETFDWQSIFVFLIFYLSIILICVLRKPESLKSSFDQKRIKIFSLYRSHLKNRIFLLFGLTILSPTVPLICTSVAFTILTGILVILLEKNSAHIHSCRTKERDARKAIPHYSNPKFLDWIKDHTKIDVTPISCEQLITCLKA